MEKNNLDNLFKEKFDGFSEIPDEGVWERIEASLDKKKKKRIVPIWWQLGGAAAAIALLFYFINPFGSQNETNTPTIVDTEQQIENGKVNPVKKNELGTEAQEKSNDTQVVFENNPSEETTTSSEDEGSESTKSEGFQQLLPKKRKGLLNTQRQVAENTAGQKGKEVSNAVISKTDSVITDGGATEKNSGIAVNDTKSNPLEEKNRPISDEVIKSDPVEETKVAVAKNDEEVEKKSIYDAIAEKEALDEEAIVENDKSQRWSMGPSVAPVFFSSIGEGSPIHSNFASNSKSGNLNLSYGLTVSYNISEKLSVRSGVHRVDYGYDTNDIVFTSSLATSTNQLIDNITYAQTSRNLVVESKNNAPNADVSNAVVAQAQPLEGRMVQQLGYVEVPMELNYALVDKKFGVNIIGGFSSLFLVDNAVSLESDRLITEMGEANNANDINFSTNIGLGINYDISQKLQLNVEPIFKYQLNTFSESAGNFRPYSVGVYSGLSFRF